MNQKKQVNVEHAGTPKYRKMLEKIIADNVCPFCVDFCQGKKPLYHPNPILIENKWWIVTENVRKYEGVTEQFLFVPKIHVESIEKLPTEYWKNLHPIIKKIIKKYNLRWGSFLMRFGDTDGTSASVTHLHVQIIVGAKRKKNSSFLFAPVGYKK